MNPFTIFLAFILPFLPFIQCLRPRWGHWNGQPNPAPVSSVPVSSASAVPQAPATQTQVTQAQATPPPTTPSDNTTTTTTTGSPSGACPAVSGTGNVYVNDYDSLPATGGDGACGLPYGSLTRDHIVSLSGNLNGGPNCGVCLKVCGSTTVCDYFIVADGKTGDGLDVDWSGAGAAVVGGTTGHMVSTWTSVDQSFCKGFWTGVSDNTPAYGCLAGLQ